MCDGEVSETTSVVSEGGIRAVDFRNRLTVVGVAEQLLDIHLGDSARALIDAVRCCGEFPECSHVLAWVEEYDLLALTTDDCGAVVSDLESQS